MAVIGLADGVETGGVAVGSRGTRSSEKGLTGMRNMKYAAIGCFVICGVLLFVAYERYQTNASNVAAMNEMSRSSPLGGLMGGEHLTPATPASTKYALFFAVLAAAGGIACLVAASKTAVSRNPGAP
jgi:hypothetical protein